jgi:serine/arginine repetitive matrix protein 2
LSDNHHFNSFVVLMHDSVSTSSHSLSRRFTLLRNNTGSPATLDALRSRFAEQRARGSANQISKEEEDMVLASLKRLQPRSTTTTTSKSSDTDGEDSQSTATASPSKKRYDHNNLFGASGRLRDYSYVRTARTSGASASSRSNSAKASMQHHNMDASSTVSSPPGTPKASERFSTQTGTAQQRGENDFQGPVDAEKVSESFPKRASLALEAAIREMEEEAEDEIVMERSTPITRTSPGTHPMNVNGSQERFAGVSVSVRFFSRTVLFCSFEATDWLATCI